MTLRSTLIRVYHGASKDDFQSDHERSLGTRLKSETNTISTVIARRSVSCLHERELQETVFRWMRAAYDLRSTLAHGGEVSGAKVPRRPDGSEVSVVEFVATIHTYIRNALVKAINIGHEPGSPYHLVDWDELVFSGKQNEVSDAPQGME